MSTHKAKIRSATDHIGKYEADADGIVARFQSEIKDSHPANSTQCIENGKRLKQKALDAINKKMDEMLTMASEKLPAFVGGWQRTLFLKSLWKQALALARARATVSMEVVGGVSHVDIVFQGKLLAIEFGLITTDVMQEEIRAALPAGLPPTYEACKAQYDAFLLEHAFLETMNRTFREEVQGKVSEDMENTFSADITQPTSSKLEIFRFCGKIGNTIMAIGQAYAPINRVKRTLADNAQHFLTRQSDLINSASQTRIDRPAPKDQSWIKRFDSEFEHVVAVQKDLYNGIGAILDDEIVAKPLLKKEQKSRELLLSLAEKMDAVVIAFEELNQHCDNELGSPDGNHCAQARLILSELRYRQFFAQTVCLAARLFAPYLPSCPVEQDIVPAASTPTASTDAGQTAVERAPGAGSGKERLSAQAFVAELDALVTPAKVSMAAANKHVERYVNAMSRLTATDALGEACAAFKDAARKFGEAIAFFQKDERTEVFNHNVDALRQAQKRCLECMELYAEYGKSELSQLPTEETLVKLLDDDNLTVTSVQRNARTPRDLFEFIIQRKPFESNGAVVPQPPLYLHIHVPPGGKLRAPEDITASHVKAGRYRYYGQEYEKRTGQEIVRVKIADPAVAMRFVEAASASRQYPARRAEQDEPGPGAGRAAIGGGIQRASIS